MTSLRLARRLSAPLVQRAWLASGLIAATAMIGCASATRIHDRPISFSDERVALTREYIEEHYGGASTGIEIVPRIIVLHWTAIDGLEASFRAFDRETITAGSRPELAGASQVNVSIHFLVDRDGTVYRLMPETWMARHVIGLNHAAIGIENVGGAGGVDNLTDEQIAANARLVRHLARKYSTIEYLIGHQEYQSFEGHALWLERDAGYRTTKIDPGERFMSGVREAVADLRLKGPPPARDRRGVSHIRVNQVGYLPDAPKVAVVCSLEPQEAVSFRVVDADGRSVLENPQVLAAQGFGPCVTTHRLNFTSIRDEGAYQIEMEGAEPVRVRVAADAYRGGADTLLMYMRQQRSGFNPFFGDSVHHRTDGILVDHPTRAGEFIPVSGGWADAADYLQYVTTSATAAFVMLMAYRDNPGAFADLHAADGLPGANGVADVLDEARHGLRWLDRMFPEDSLMLNQLGDDRDHSFFDLPTTDSSDYGWGKGGFRPVYPCTARPQGVVRPDHRNRSSGYASTAGKYAAAMALGAMMLVDVDPALAGTLREKAVAAYELGRRYPGVCQTAPGGAPYFYEEDNWVDDMELGASQLHVLTGENRYLAEAVMYARQEPVTPWMGADTARHYQWYPWHNNGHHEIWRSGGESERDRMVEYYREGLDRVVAQAGNGFLMGVPFIWCSSNLIASFATQAYLYRQMTGDDRFREHEQAALDWLFGANPWGVSMVIGYPADGRSPRNPHSVVAHDLGVQSQTGGLVDGPVYAAIFQNLRGIRLWEDDEFATFNSGHVVYHDDFGDYSTNEPIMDGTANLVYLLSALGVDEPRGL